MIRSLALAACLLPFVVFSQPLPQDTQTEIPGLYSSPEGIIKASAGYLIRDIKAGKLYIKTNASDLATGWMEVGAVGEAGGAGGLTNGYSFTAPLILTGTNVTLDPTAVPWTNSAGLVRIVSNTNVYFAIEENFLGKVDPGSEFWRASIFDIDGSFNTLFQVGKGLTNIAILSTLELGYGNGVPAYEASAGTFYRDVDAIATNAVWLNIDGTNGWVKLGAVGADNLWTNDLGVLHPVELTNNVTIGGKLEVKTNITFNGTTPVIISGGATYGNARGAGSLDVQASHLSSQVASGAGAAAVGMGNTASGAGAMAFGNGNNVSISSGTAFGQVNTVSTGSGAMAFGIGNSATGVNSMALGQSSTASAASAIAVGTAATSDAQFTVNVTGPIMNWKSEVAKGGNNSGATGDYRYYSGVQVVLMGQEVDLETTQDYTVNIASGLHFYPDETGVIVTSANTVGGQPSVSFGISGNTTKLLGATATTGLTAAFKRQRFATLLTSEGETTVTGSVTTGATATTLLGRFYWKGLLVRDQ